MDGRQLPGALIEMNRREWRRGRRETGFTLLEVMIAAMVLVAGMMSIMGLFGLALATHRSNIDRARVAMIRADVLPEAQREALVVDPDTGEVSYKDLQRRPVPGHPGFFYALAIETTAEEGRAEVAVLTISWQAGGRLRTAQSRHVLRAEKSFKDLIHTRFRKERQP
jgi:Tfp pilus assembly protein PilV